MTSPRAAAARRNTTCRGCGVVFIGPDRWTRHAEHTWTCSPGLARAGLTEVARRLREG